jgi:hypothetical protein
MPAEHGLRQAAGSRSPSAVRNSARHGIATICSTEHGLPVRTNTSCPRDGTGGLPTNERQERSEFARAGSSPHASGMFVEIPWATKGSPEFAPRRIPCPRVASVLRTDFFFG